MSDASSKAMQVSGCCVISFGSNVFAVESRLYFKKNILNIVTCPKTFLSVQEANIHFVVVVVCVYTCDYFNVYTNAYTVYHDEWRFW